MAVDLGKISFQRGKKTKQVGAFPSVININTAIFPFTLNSIDPNANMLRAKYPGWKQCAKDEEVFLVVKVLPFCQNCKLPPFFGFT